MKKYLYGVGAIVLLLLGVFFVQILDDRIIIDLPSENCEKLTLVVHEDYNKLKCGRFIVAEWKEYLDRFQTYGEPDKWVNNWRKKTKIELYVLDSSPDHFVVVKEVPYYKKRSGTDGTLFIKYKFTKDSVKWSYEFKPENNNRHRIRLKLDRFEDKYGYDFFPEDKLYYANEDNVYYYGNVSGILNIDPLITLTAAGSSAYLNLTIETYNTTKKWELYTTPEITCSLTNQSTGATINRQVCIGVGLHDYGNNFTCENRTVGYNFTIPYVEINRFYKRDPCYQETVNESHATDGDCNLIYSGSYVSDFDALGVKYELVNATKVRGTSGVIIKNKGGHNSSLGFPIRNTTVPNKCFVFDATNFSYGMYSRQDNTAHQVRVYCYNETPSIGIVGSNGMAIFNSSDITSGSGGGGSNKFYLLFDGDWLTGAHDEDGTNDWQNNSPTSGGMVFEEALWHIFEGFLSYAVTGNNSVAIYLKNWSEVENMTFDLSSNQSETDLRLNMSGGIAEFNLRGYLQDSFLNEKRYSDNTTTKDFDLLASTTDSQNILLSMAGNFSKNITLTINASQANPESLSYHENWNSTENFNDTATFNADLPLFTFDDLNSEVSGRWNYDTSGSGTAEYDGSNDYITVSGDTSASVSGSAPLEDTDTSNSWANSKDLDFDETNQRIDMSVYLQAAGQSLSSGSGWGSGIAYTKLYLTDDDDGVTNRVELLSCTCQGGGGCSGDCVLSCGTASCSNTLSGTLSLRRTTSGTYKVYYGGSYKRTVTPPSTNVNIEAWQNQVSGAGVNTGSGSGTGTASAEVRISFIGYGGFGNNFSQAGSNYSTGLFSGTSDVLLNASSNITSVRPTFSEVQPDGCDARLYVSANNGTNWQEAVSGDFLTFTTPGTRVVYNMSLNVSSTNNLTPCAIHDVQLEISSSNPENLTVYYGSSAYGHAYNMTGVLNTSTTPLDLSMNQTPLVNYIGDNCDNLTTCTVPLVFEIGSAGLISAYNLSFNQTLNDLFVNGSKFDDYLSTCQENCEINITVNDSSGGNLNFSDLALRYAGDNNITINCTSEGSTAYLDMIVKYSPFYLDFTQIYLQYLAFLDILTPTDKNISPEGQRVGSSDNRSIFNFTPDSPDHSIDLGILSNESLNASAYNYTVTNATVNDKKVIINDSLQIVLTNNTYLTSYDVFMFLDLFNASSAPAIQLQNYFVSYCSDNGDGYGFCVRVD